MTAHTEGGQGHTPGDWRVAKWDADSPANLKHLSLVQAPYDSDPQDIAYVGPRVEDDCDKHGKAEQLANAHLIAAAPDLLAACEAALETITDVLCRQNGTDPALNIFDNVGARIALRAAIAKAKGGA